MMRYIRADASANTVFDINDTHVGFYPILGIHLPTSKRSESGGMNADYFFY